MITSSRNVRNCRLQGSTLEGVLLGLPYFTIQTLIWLRVRRTQMRRLNAATQALLQRQKPCIPHGNFSKAGEKTWWQELFAFDLHLFLFFHLAQWKNSLDMSFSWRRMIPYSRLSMEMPLLLCFPDTYAHVPYLLLCSFVLVKELIATFILPFFEDLSSITRN